MKNVALITGASSGLGLEFAKIHAKKGGDLVLTARRTEKLNSIKSDLESNYGVSVYLISNDLSLPESPKEIYDELKSKNIEIDYLINNAGFGGIGKFHERNWEDDKQMMELNMVALTDLTRRFLPDFVAKKKGKVLNVASTAALVPGPLQAVYYATKAYVHSFSLAIAEELNGTGVTVTSLLPGATATEFGKVSGMDKTSLFNKTASANKVANDGYTAMINGKLMKKSGMTFMQKIMMAFVPLTPTKIVLKQIKSMQKVK